MTGSIDLSKTPHCELRHLPISELELSVRTMNVAKKAGWETIGDLLYLTKKDVLSQRNAGHRTWNEIKGLQEWLSPRARRAEIERRACSLIADLNTLLGAHPGYRVWIEGNRLVLGKVLVGRPEEEEPDDE